MSAFDSDSGYELLEGTDDFINSHEVFIMQVVGNLYQKKIMESSRKYETRLIAFIDILGWTRAIKEKQFDELYDVINKIQVRCDSYTEHRRKELEKLEGFRINPMFFQVKFSMFSDAIAISMPISFEARICNTCSELIREFILNGFLLRGGVAEGRLFHNEQTIFGDAIVEAYKLESEYAKYSRVMVARRIVDLMKRSDPTSIIRDHLGEYVVDPFPMLAKGLTADALSQMYELDRLVAVIETNLKNIVDLSALQKWEYMAKLATQSLSKFDDLTKQTVHHLSQLTQ